MSAQPGKSGRLQFTAPPVQKLPGTVPYNGQIVKKKKVLHNIIELVFLLCHKQKIQLPMLIHARAMWCTENWCIMIHIVQFYVPIQNSKLRFDPVQNLVSHVNN